MFGIGKVLSQVLDQHNLGELSGRIETGSAEEMRESIEALGASGEIHNVGSVLKDISTQLSGALQNVSETLTHIVEDIEFEADGDASRALDAVGATAATETGQPAFEAPVDAQLVPHEAVHTLQGVAVEDDDILATEAEALASGTTAPTVQAEEGDDTVDD